MTRQAPIWLLDVDGVINCLDHTSDYWPLYQQTTQRGYVLHYAPALVRRIAAVHNSGLAEVWWLTTWRNHANVHLAEIFGLPQLTVANTNREYSVRDTWWKLPVAQRVALETNRPLVWTDDDLRHSTEAKQWIASRPHVLGIAPNPDHGLTPHNMDTIEWWLKQPSVWL